MLDPAYAALGPPAAWGCILLARWLEALDLERLERELEDAFGCTVLRKDGRR